MILQQEPQLPYYTIFDQLPENIRRLIYQYEQSKGREVELPFVTKYRHEDLYRSKRGQPCQWVCLETAKPVEAEQFILRRNEYFIVVRGGGLHDPTIIHTRPYYGTPPNSRFYFFWKGLGKTGKSLQFSGYLELGRSTIL
jgi:hypothetical protein